MALIKSTSKLCNQLEGQQVPFAGKDTEEHDDDQEGRGDAGAGLGDDGDDADRREVDRAWQHHQGGPARRARRKVMESEALYMLIALKIKFQNFIPLVFRPDKVYLTFTYEWTDLVSTYTWCRKKIR